MFHVFHKIEQTSIFFDFKNLWKNPVDTRKKSSQALEFQRSSEWSFPHALVDKIVYNFCVPCGKVSKLEKSTISVLLKKHRSKNEQSALKNVFVLIIVLDFIYYFFSEQIVCFIRQVRQNHQKTRRGLCTVSGKQKCLSCIFLWPR